jgi:hypothetical protein
VDGLGECFVRYFWGFFVFSDVVWTSARLVWVLVWFLMGVFRVRAHYEYQHESPCFCNNFTVTISNNSLFLFLHFRKRIGVGHCSDNVY